MSTRARPPRLDRRVPATKTPAPASDSEDEPHEQISASSGEQEHERMSEDDTYDTSRRRVSHSSAAAGPSSIAAAANSCGVNKGRAVAAKDAASLLPSSLDEEMLKKAFRQLHPRHRMQKQALVQSYRTHFGHWRFLLRQRFSLLFYGFGSKIDLLELFANQALTDGGVMAVYGHQPNITSKQVLAAVASALTHHDCRRHSHTDSMLLINSEPPSRQLYVIIHNIDGPGLRSAEEQLWLSRLAQAPAVRLIASVDHVNAALLWDNRLAAAFSWLWVDTTSYTQYEVETRNMLPVLTSSKQTAAKRGAATVLSSLVSTARDVFRVIADVQLEDPSSAGVSFPLLLRMVRERFILSHEHQLRSLLAEFRDHELIKFRPGPDGAEVMYIAMETDVLQKALQELDEAVTA